MNSIDDVLRCIGRIVMVLALCCAIGLHWIALQSLAWTAMVIQYSKCARAWPSDRADVGRRASVFTLSRREQRHGFGKEVWRAITSFEDRHRVRRSNISAFAEIGSIRLPRE